MGSCSSNATIKNDVVKRPANLPTKQPSEQKSSKLIDEDKPLLDHPHHEEDSKPKRTFTDRKDAVDEAMRAPLKKLNEARKNLKKHKFREAEAEDDVVYENVAKQDKKIDADATAFLVKSLKAHSFFSNLSAEEL